MKFNGTEKSLFNIMDKMSITEDMYICIISTWKKEKRASEIYTQSITINVSKLWKIDDLFFFLYDVIFFYTSDKHYMSLLRIEISVNKRMDGWIDNRWAGEKAGKVWDGWMEVWVGRRMYDWLAGCTSIRVGKLMDE